MGRDRDALSFPSLAPDDYAWQSYDALPATPDSRSGLASPSNASTDECALHEPPPTVDDATVRGKVIYTRPGITKVYRMLYRNRAIIVKQFVGKNKAEMAKRLPEWFARTNTLRGHAMLCHLIPVAWDPRHEQLLMPEAIPLDKWVLTPHSRREWEHVLLVANRVLRDVVVCCQMHGAVAPDLKVANLALVPCDERSPRPFDIKIIDIDSIDLSSADSGNSTATDHTYTCAELRALAESNPSAANQVYTVFSAALTMMELERYRVLGVRAQHLAGVLKHNEVTMLMRAFTVGYLHREPVDSIQKLGRLDGQTLSYAWTDSIYTVKGLVDWHRAACAAVNCARTCLFLKDGASAFDHPQLVDFPKNIDLRVSIANCAYGSVSSTARWVFGTASMQTATVPKGAIDADAFVCNVVLGRCPPAVLLRLLPCKNNAVLDWEEGLTVAVDEARHSFSVVAYDERCSLSVAETAAKKQAAKARWGHITSIDGFPVTWS